MLLALQGGELVLLANQNSAVGGNLRCWHNRVEFCRGGGDLRCWHSRVLQGGGGICAVGIADFYRGGSCGRVGARVMSTSCFTWKDLKTFQRRNKHVFESEVVGLYVDAAVARQELEALGSQAGVVTR